jgi:arabinose-5-phosphate isomerase
LWRIFNDKFLKKVHSPSMLQLARETILMEAETLVNLASSLDDAFLDAIKMIDHCKGKIVVTGVGKSALIGRKIVSTFNSIDVASLFLHSADALHGDLGSIQPGDVVICLSKSGETPELKALIPLIKDKGNALIAVTAHPTGFLARQVEVAIITPVEKEADPNNLAPTTSTIAQMAVGDAIAVCLMHLRGFQAADFALLHPGGMLGKQLNMLVRDLIIHHERPEVLLDAPVDEVIVEISSKRLGATAVLDHDHNICGIITDGDLRRMLERKTDYHKLSARDIMSHQPKVIALGEKAIKALDQIRQNNITQLLVVDQNRYVGVIHIHDLLKEGF